ncbi:MAG: CYTH and CHAD domain-containing protein [Alphaproteobacteria bacterium]
MPWRTEQTARPMIDVDQESVIRLRLSAEAARGLVRRPPVRDWLAGRPRSRRLAATYYDTAEESLRKGGITLSVKTGERQRTQVAAADAASVSSVLADDAGPDLARIRDADVRARALHLVSDAALTPAFQADVRIRTYPLAIEGTPVELAVSIGQISAADAADGFVEAAFHAADRATAYAAAEALADAIPVSVERRDFVARGYDLAHGRRFQVVLAQDVALDGEWSTRRGFDAVLRNCLDQFAANEDAFAVGGGSEAIHQLRVAIRRMRAAFSAFASVLPPDQTADFRADLRWLQQIFGPLRDWDVFCNETMATLREALPHHDGLRELAAGARAARGQALVSAREALASVRHGLFQVRLERWLEKEAGGEGVPLAEFAANALAKRDRKLRRAGKALDGSSPERLHDIRIAAKKARYAAEFFRDLFGGKATRKYLRALRRIQDGLGAMNDANMARRLVAEIRPGDREMAALLDGWFAARVVASRADIGALWRKFERAPRYWEG